MPCTVVDTAAGRPRPAIARQLMPMGILLP
jgi:hypothetical protein